MSALRGVVPAALVVLAVVLQAAVLTQVAILGVVPDLCLLVVLAVGLVQGREAGAVAGFLAGLALDLAPPADHVAGRWALAFAVAGYLAGVVVRTERVRVPSWFEPRSRLGAAAIGAAASLVAGLLFQLGGLVVHDTAGSFGDVLGVLLVAVVLDAVAALVLLPHLVDLLVRLRPARLRDAPGTPLSTPRRTSVDA